MATSSEIEEQAKVVEIKSREVHGIDELESAVSSIDVFEVVCLVQKTRIDSLIQELEQAKNAVNGDELRQGVLVINTGNDVVLVSEGQIDAVGNHLKNVFLPAARSQAELERDAAITELNDMINE